MSIFSGVTLLLGEVGDFGEGRWPPRLKARQLPRSCSYMGGEETSSFVVGGDEAGRSAAHTVPGCTSVACHYTCLLSL